MSPTEQTLMARLADTIESRRAADPETSYVARLLSKAPDAALKKVGEEATEVVMAAKDHAHLGSPRTGELLVGEVADLWFHCLIVLAQAGLRPEQVLAELARREGLSGLDEKAARKAQTRDASPGQETP